MLLDLNFSLTKPLRWLSSCWSILTNNWPDRYSLIEEVLGKRKPNKKNVKQTEQKEIQEQTNNI